MTQEISGNVLFFLSEACLRLYLNTHAIVAQAVKSYGGNPIFWECEGKLLRCPQMQGQYFCEDVTQEQRNVFCKVCKVQIANLKSTFNFETIKFTSLINDDDEKTAREVFDLPAEELSSFVFQDVPLGKIMLCDFYLIAKRLHFDYNIKKYEMFFRETLHDGVLLIIATKKIINSKKIKKVISFNPYAICQVVNAISSMNGVSCDIITVAHNAGADQSLLNIDKYQKIFDNIHHASEWNKYKDKKIPQNYINKCYYDCFFRLFSTGSHVFSPSKTTNQKSLLRKLSLDMQKKVIVIYTSSLDEALSIDARLKVLEKNNPKHSLFESQSIWIREVEKYADSHNLQLIVRIHPREGRGGGSEHLKVLRNELASPLPCTRIIWPDSPISSYDVLELADIVLVSVSTMGIEAARMGVPALSYVTNLFYKNAGFLQTAATLDEYWEKIQKMLVSTNDINSLRETIRFYAWQIFYSCIDLSPQVAPYYDGNIFPKADDDGEKNIISVLYGGKSQYDIAKESLEAFQNNTTEQDEYTTIKYNIRKVINALFFGCEKNRFYDYELTVCKTNNDEYFKKIIEITQKDKKHTVLICKDKFCFLIRDGVISTRISGIVRNLADIYTSIK